MTFAAPLSDPRLRGSGAALALGLGLAAAGCAPSLIDGEAADKDAGADGASTPAPGGDGDDGDGDGDGDGGTGGDTAPPDDTAEPTEEIPSSVARVVAAPAGGAFVDRQVVTLSIEGRADDDTGAPPVALYACVADPDRTCALAPTDGSVELRGSGVLMARADVAGIPGTVQAWSFVEVDEELAAFSSHLPVMVAWTPSPGASLEADTAVTLNVFTPSGGATSLGPDSADSGRARLRVRGSSSSGLDKKNYDLELWQPLGDDDRSAALLGLPEDGDWVLHAPSYYDDALIRNALGYALSNDIGRYAPRTAFFELFVARGAGAAGLDDYAGLYVLVEEIERGSDRVAVTRLGEDDVDLPEVSGGYVFKRDRLGEGDLEIWAGDAGGALRFSVPIVPVDPGSSKLVEPQVDYLWGELDSLGRAVVAADGTDSLTGRHYDEIIDVDSFIDLHILNVLFKNPDAFRLSAYYHKDREGPVTAGPLWDLDRTAGSRDWRALDPLHWDASNETTDTTTVFTYGWQGGLFSHAAFRAAYFARWQTLLAGPLSNAAIQARIDALQAEIGDAGARNQARWGSRDFAGEVDNVRGWFAQRTAWVAACIETTDDPRLCAGAEVLDGAR